MKQEQKNFFASLIQFWFIICLSLFINYKYKTN
jgi:hypothetical protein